MCVAAMDADSAVAERALLGAAKTSTVLDSVGTLGASGWPHLTACSGQQQTARGKGTTRLWAAGHCSAPGPPTAPRTRTPALCTLDSEPGLTRVLGRWACPTQCNTTQPNLPGPPNPTNQALHNLITPILRGGHTFLCSVRTIINLEAETASQLMSRIKHLIFFRFGSFLCFQVHRPRPPQNQRTPKPQKHPCPPAGWHTAGGAK
mmetsp:Transcript_21545/g.38681  ORF Transcript_21545/g.38681 Transcript_21545/m.38681 type:complete len:205 (+) Transcript_21545:251-865(+)